MHMYKRMLLCAALVFSNLYSHTDMYFCMAADTEFYPQLTNLIGSLHRYDFDNIVAIAVFDLGFTPQERANLNSMEKVHVYNIELTHPDLLTKFNTRAKGKPVRGWYAWKPVAIKQALDIFPYVLYIDAGISVKGSLKDIFKQIKRNNYSLTTCGRTINGMSTQIIRNHFNLDSAERQSIGTANGISAGIQGLSHALYDTYVLPIYNLTKDLRYFADDGSTPSGFGTSRHDQPIFSIYAQLLGLKIRPLHGEKGFYNYIKFKESFSKIKRIRYKPAPVQVQQTVACCDTSKMDQ